MIAPMNRGLKLDDEPAAEDQFRVRMIAPMNRGLKLGIAVAVDVSVGVSG